MLRQDRVWASCLTICATAFFFAGALIPFIAPGPRWKNLGDYGSAIAGLWALAAGLLTLLAAQRALLEQQRAAVRLRQDTMTELALVIDAELKGLWETITAAQIERKLQDSIDKMGDPKAFLPATGIYVHGEWLRTRASTPSSHGMFGRLLSERLVDLYTRLASVVGRLNWLNKSPFEPGSRDALMRAQRDVLSELDQLRKLTTEARSMLSAFIGHAETALS